ncbi:MAG TPA: serine hydrolase domain-containing protein [Gemmataceae bacterium]|nr:serine hydrolase domain-containing protein [Gemmataceae bacterium]
MTMLTLYLALIAQPADRLSGIDDAVKAAIARGELPGAVVVIVHKEKVVYRKAFGHRVKAPQHTLMTEDTVFDLASLTKPIATALSIMLLLEDGKLKLEDPIAKHLPAFARKETEKITIAQLLTHTGGFIADNPIGDYKDGKDKAWEKLLALNPIAPPGSKFTYSDVSFILLGKIVESASKTPLDEFAARRIFTPLGMKETGYRVSGDLKKRCSPTQQREGRWMVGEVHDPRAYALGGVAGHAGLFSTGDDLAILAKMMLNKGKPLLREETWKVMTEPRKVPNGLRTYGWDMATGYSANRGDVFPKGVSFGHTGFTGTSIWIDPRSQTAVIFLSNRVHPDGKGNVTKLRARVATIAGRVLAN